ncbi:DUF922 domain-containing protein [Winogradskyella jejuensis]|uniref:DUF922 domain-containing protein n=1 Tax=Winogradskyella jejuensis TaxID=1089305 RepID=A0A1M5SE94_9FLAO|nr:DUF922 domain-containing protein [Winogradskyella jejuensis]SHH36755.1 protein of unknown function [Winogradskyella jejuensis]
MIRLFFALLFVTSFTFAQDKDLETFSWQEDRPLVWADFKGKPNPNTDAAALTASGISFGFSIGKTGNRITDFSTTVECLFYPSESWYKVEDADDHILKHEQLHFNITELHARMFRQQISELRASSQLKTQLNSLYKAISKASYEMQNKYDDETNHSINKEQQAAWQNYITAELKKLEAFKTQ